MKNIIFGFCLFGLFILFACEKDKSTSIPVLAGCYDSTYNYYKYLLPLQLDFKWDDQHKFAFADTMFDLNFDQEGNVFIEASISESENTVTEDFIGRVYPHYNLAFYNGWEVSIYEDIYGMGHGKTSTWNYIDTLCYGKRIDQISKWSTQCSLWHRNSEYFTPSAGGWLHARKTMYVGVRNNDKFGWIEIDATDPLYLKIKSFAIQK